ncbi:MAG: hypothetical protein ACI9QQ_001104 [Myxococcota bacterium]
MNFKKSYLVSLTFAASCLLMISCSQGDSSSNGDAQKVSFGISDAPVENLSSVTITIESMTIGRNDEEDIVIDSFNTGDGEVEQVTVNLLDFQGSDHMLFIQELELEAGTYQNIRLEVVDEDIESSFVIEVGSEARKELMVPSDTLQLGGFEVEDEGSQIFVLEFNLPRSMTYNPGPGPDRYILKPRGVRVIGVETAGSIGGVASEALLAACDAGDLDHSNRMYLYEGHGHDVANLADAFNPTVDLAVPEASIEPIAVEALNEEGGFNIAFLRAADYTLAFLCNGAPDDADIFNGLVIPAPEGTVIEITVEPGDSVMCDFGIEAQACAELDD